MAFEGNPELANFVCNVNRMASRTLVNLSSHVAGLGLDRVLVRIERQSISLSYSLVYVSLVRMVVYSPQVIENYQLQSGEGLSVGFVVIWLIGDICNFTGAIIAGLLPTIILLGIYVSPSIVQAHPREPADTACTTYSTPCATPPFLPKFTTIGGSGCVEAHRSFLPRTHRSLPSATRQVRSCREAIALKNRTPGGLYGWRP